MAVLDMGPEFISGEFSEWMEGHSITPYWSAVEAPWQNGVAERSGGVLKVLLNSIVSAHSCVTKEDMKFALAEALGGLQ